MTLTFGSRTKSTFACNPIKALGNLQYIFIYPYVYPYNIHIYIYPNARNNMFGNRTYIYIS
jgi:hypothetical protein